MRHPLKVSDVMTRDVITVTEETPYKEIVSVLAENHISAVPVVNRYGGIGGIVSETDLIRKEEFQRRQTRWPLRWWRRAPRRPGSGPVR